MQEEGSTAKSLSCYRMRLFVLNKVCILGAVIVMGCGASSTLRADYAGTVMSFNPVMYWRLDEPAWPDPTGQTAVN